MAQSSTRSLRLLLLIVLGFFYSVFMIAAAFAPNAFAGPVYPGATVSLWFVYGIVLIWSVVLATGLYIVVTNAGERA